MLETQRLKHQLIFLYKIKYNHLNISLPQHLIVRCTRTRNSDPNKFFQIPARVNTYAYSFYPRVIRAWNLIPNEIITLMISSIDTFHGSGREHFPTCSTSPSKSFVNTNHCKTCYFNSRFIRTILFKSFIINFYVTFCTQSQQTPMYL